MDEDALRELWNRSFPVLDLCDGAPCKSYRPAQREVSVGELGTGDPLSRETLDKRSNEPAEGGLGLLGDKHSAAPFQLLEELGRGGMGVVYRARSHR